MILSCRYIEIFKSSMQELRTASIGSRGGRGMGMGMGRPGPYDRSDRFMGGGGGLGGGMGYGRGRGRGNLKGTYIYIAGPVPRSKCVPIYLFRIPGI